KRFFRESADAVAADDTGSWRATFAEGMFLPTDTARRADIIEQMTAMTSPAISAEVMRVMGEFDGAGTLAAATVPVLAIGSAGPPHRARRPAPPVPGDHRRPDRRRRSFQPA